MQVKHHRKKIGETFRHEGFPDIIYTAFLSQHIFEFFFRDYSDTEGFCRFVLGGI